MKVETNRISGKLVVSCTAPNEKGLALAKNVMTMSHPNLPQTVVGLTVSVTLP